MRCKFVHHLRAYMDDELPLPQREQLQRHLAECPQCAGEVDGLQRVERLLAELSPVAVPDHLAAATLQRLRTRPSTPMLLFRRAPGLTAAVAAAACLLMALHVLVPTDSDTRQPLSQVVASVETASPVAMVILPVPRLETKRPVVAPAPAG
jgi:anti-sigma factor RsiW